jgi:NAD(P)-dependent dehydrogenase (short-subunit alcohol dehydrogenase family)
MEPKSIRCAIVTGAGGGIGRAICLRLACDGWQIAATDVDLDAARETARLVDEAGGIGLAELLDVRDRAAWNQLRERLAADWPGLDLLVNNAGVTAAGRFERTPAETWNWVQAVNLDGPIHGCRAMLPWLRETAREAGGSRKTYVMNVSSAAGVLAGPRQSAYNVAKAALVALSETLHHELRPHGVGVTAVCPWYLPTGLIARGKFDLGTERGYVARITRRSKLTVDDVAREALRATFRGRTVCVVGRPAKALFLLKRLAPELYARIVGRMYERTGGPAREVIHPVDNRDGVAAASSQAVTASSS